MGIHLLKIYFYIALYFSTYFALLAFKGGRHYDTHRIRVDAKDNIESKLKFSYICRPLFSSSVLCSTE